MATIDELEVRFAQIASQFQQAKQDGDHSDGRQNSVLTDLKQRTEQLVAELESIVERGN